jgi:hypothetical protein
MKIVAPTTNNTGQVLSRISEHATWIAMLAQMRASPLRGEMNQIVAPTTNKTGQVLSLISEHAT